MAADKTSDVAGDILPYDEVITSTALEAIRDDTNLRGHPALVDIRTLNPTVDLPKGMQLEGVVTIPIKNNVHEWSATDEATSAHGETATEWDTVSISVSDYDLCKGMTDSLRRRDPTGSYDVVGIALDMVKGYTKTFTSAIATLSSNWTATVGDSGSAITWPTIKAAQGRVHVNGGSQGRGSYVCTLHPEQWVSVQADIAAAGGQVQMRREFDSTQMALPNGYQGSYDGIDFYSIDAVPAGEEEGDYVGQLFAEGAVGFLELTQPPPTQSMFVVLDLDGVVRVEEGRDLEGKSVKLLGAATFGVQIIRDELGCQILGTGASA